jgi:hypothetical protein
MVSPDEALMLAFRKPVYDVEDDNDSYPMLTRRRISRVCGSELFMISAISGFLGRVQFFPTGEDECYVIL